MKVRNQKKVRRNSGIAEFYVLLLLGLFVVAGLALMEMQGSQILESGGMSAKNQARFLAESALQEAKYYIMKIDGSFNGTAPEQVVTVNGKAFGTYQYTISQIGNVYNVTGVGYVPNKSAVRAISVTLTDQFTYKYLGVGVVLLAGNTPNCLSLGGNAAINVLGGRLVVNSSSSSSVSVTSNAVVNAPELDLAGGYSTSLNGKITGTIKSGTGTVADPLANLPAPNPATLPTITSSKLSITNTTTLQPGVYNGGISLSSGANVTLAPGVYYINGGGFNVSGNANLSGSGVTIYNNPISGNDSLNIGGNGIVNLTGPSSGTYKNVTLMQNRSSNVSASVGGNGTFTVSGDFYFPAANLSLTGNSRGETLGSLQIASCMNINGNGNITVNAN